MQNWGWKLLVAGLLWSACHGAAWAQFFGISADGAIAYSAAEGGISGGSFGITHPIPFVPNIGGMGFFFERQKNGNDGLDLSTKVQVTTGNLYYNIPVPVFSLAVGAGAGSARTTTDIVAEQGSIEKIKQNWPVGEGFVRVGLPFMHFFDFHIGYHYVYIGEVEITKGSETSVTGIKKKIDLSGSLTTIGLQLAL